MFGETFWGSRGRDLRLPTTGDDMAPLFEPSRANERLLIERACVGCFRLVSRHIKQYVNQHLMVSSQWYFVA